MPNILDAPERVCVDCLKSKPGFAFYTNNKSHCRECRSNSGKARTVIKNHRYAVDLAKRIGYRVVL